MSKAPKSVEAASSPVAFAASPCRSRSRNARPAESAKAFFPDDAEAVADNLSIDEALELSRKAQVAWEGMLRAKERRQKECEQAYGQHLAERDRSLLERSEALEEAERLALERRREAEASLKQLQLLEAEAAGRSRLQDERLAAQDAELHRRREELAEVRGLLEVSEMNSASQSQAMQAKLQALEGARAELSEQSSKLVEQDQRIADFRQKLESSQQLVQELEDDIAQNTQDIEAFRTSLEKERQQSASHAARAQELAAELTQTETFAHERGRLHEEQMQLAERHASTVEDQRVLLEQLRAAVRRHEQLNVEQTTSMKEMDQQLERAKKSVKDLERLAAGQSEKMVAQKLELETLTEQIDCCKQELARRENTISSQARELEQYAYVEREHAAIIEAQAQELQELRSDRQQRLKRSQSREVEFLAAREEIEDKQKKLASQGMELAKLRAAKVQAKASLSAAAEAKMQEVAALGSELLKGGERERALERRVEELQNKLQWAHEKSDKEQSLLEECAQLTRAVAGLREQASKQEVLIHDGELQAEGVASALTQAQARIAELEQQLARGQQSADAEARARIVELEQLLGQSTRAAEREERELREAGGKLTEAEARIAEQEKKLAHKDEELKGRLGDMEVTVERFQVVQRRAAELEGELEVVRQAAEEAEATRKALELDLQIAREDLQEERRRVEEHLAKTLELAEDLNALTLVGADVGDLREQNRELVLTVNQFKRDAELLDAEVRCLKDRLAVFETDLERVTGQHAELTGHINHKQKIKHTMQLKDEISSLRAKLGEAYRRITKLEVDSFGVDFFEALASLGMSMCQQEQSQVQNSCHGSRIAHLATPRGLMPEQSRATTAIGLRPRRTSSTSQLSARGAAATSPGKLANDGHSQDLGSMCQTLERRCFLQQRAFEKVSIDFSHFLALIERTVYLADADRAVAFADSPHKVQRPPLPELMRKLRDAIASSQERSSAR